MNYAAPLIYVGDFCAAATRTLVEVNVLTTAFVDDHRHTVAGSFHNVYNPNVLVLVEHTGPRPRVQDSGKTGRTARDPALSRSTPHLRHALAEVGREPQVRPGALGARRY
jgi:hypothetical protein